LILLIKIRGVWRHIIGMALLSLTIAFPAFAAELKPFERGSWNAVVTAHHGRPTAIHFWSVTCAPCLAELGEWARISSRKGVDVVLVSTDSVTDQAKVQATLRRYGLTGEDSWIFADPFVERLRFEIDRQWHGELPMTRLISADGKPETFVGGLADSPLGR
jgi:thiol-disulfide isomerase/thioredoxin